MRQNTLKLLVKLATVFAVVVLFAMIIFLTSQYIRMNQLEITQTELSEQLEELVASRESYEAEYDYIQTHYNQYIEDYAREVLGWGRDNEIKFQSQ